jgi:hypothetical protein
MKKQVILIGIITLLITLSISGCENSTDIDKNKFVGTWVGSVHVIALNQTVQNWTVIFYANGTFTEDGRTGGLWDISDGTIIMNHPTMYQIHTYTFSNNDRTVQLDSNATIYVLQKQ